MIAFTVHGRPAPAGSKRGFVNRHTGRVVITDAAAKSRPWKAQVSDAAATAMNGAPLLDGPLEIELCFFVARPKGHYGAHGLKRSAPLFPTTRPDIDKLTRACLDALSGVVYRDDSQIVRKVAIKMFGESARVEIEIKEVTA